VCEQIRGSFLIAPMSNLYQAIAAVVTVTARRWRELGRFALLFRIIESLLCAPLAALVGTWLLGRTVLDSTAVVSFLFSWRGMISVLLGSTAIVGIRLVEHAGFSAIFFAGLDGRSLSARQALRLLGRYSPALLHAALSFAGFGLLTLLPLVAVVGAFAAWLMSSHDINYYLKFRPPEFITAAVVIAMGVLITAAVFVGLIVRWRWVIQAILFEKKQAREAFARSATLTLDVRAKLTAVVIGVTLFSLGLGMVASLFGSACTSLLLRVTGQSVTVLAFAFGLLLLLRTLIGAVFTFFGCCLDAGIFTVLYRRRVAAEGEQASLENMDEAAQMISRRGLVTAFAVSVLVFGGSAAFLALDAISRDRPIYVHAHRGVATHAPENTLAAMRAAIAAGADYMETDVQLSRDDVLVIAHDSDFSRLGGVAKKVWELTYEEIRAIPLGRQSAPEFRNEVSPTLDALLAEAKGRIKVNIELKYYGDHQPGLARKVVETVRAQGMIDQVVIQSLDYESLLEVRRLASDIAVGYLLSFNARDPSRLTVDFLAVEQNRLNRRFLSQAHQHGMQVYAWTVDTVQDLQRQLDLGVDGVITDQSALARKTLDEYLQLSKWERSIRRVRAWLAE
jgi:glycerophosphoryl diester phosphodiesterase